EIDIEVDGDHFIVDEPDQEEPEKEATSLKEQKAKEEEDHKEREDNQVLDEALQSQYEIEESKEICQEHADLLEDDNTKQQLDEPTLDEAPQTTENQELDVQEQPEELDDIEVDEGWGGEELNVDDDYMNLQEGKSGSEEDKQSQESSP